MERNERMRRTGVQTLKQKTHTMMWGINEQLDFVAFPNSRVERKFNHSNAAGMIALCEMPNGLLQRMLNS